MPISSVHPLYDAQKDQWQKCRDAYDGEVAVKKRGHEYLPKPGGLDSREYEAYVQRALFYEAVGRTIDGFVGAISRKDPVLQLPAALDPVVEDATSDGLTLFELVKQLCSEAILQGRGGLLVDFDADKGRPFLSPYQAEAITNWSDAGVVLHETVYETDPADPFQQKAVDQYRQLTLVDGVYTVNVWRKSASAVAGDEWSIHETTQPSIRGTKFTELPFYWVTPLGKTSRLEKPPLMGLVNVALSHYRNSADLEHGRHFTGLPTLYVTGVTQDMEVRVGSLAAIQLQEANAKVGYAEFTGQGLQSLENALAAKEQMMAVLGASVFHDGKKGVEAAETARIRTSGETSLLTGVVTAVEETVIKALECAAKWLNASGPVEVTLNREFIDTTLDGPAITGLVQAFQAGALSLPQFLYNMQQADLLAPDTDLEEEQKVIEAAKAKADADAVKLAQATKPAPPAPGAQK